VSQSAIDTRVANAPTAKKSQRNDLVVVRNLEKVAAESSVVPQAQPQPKPQVQQQRETQPQVQSNGSKGAYYNKKV
jgi:hypothetical protein